MRRHQITIVALALGASLLLGDSPAGAAVPSFMPQTTKQHVVLEQAPPEKAAEIRERANKLKEEAAKRREERTKGKKPSSRKKRTFRQGQR